MKHSPHRETCFLGWNAPLLPAAASRLLQRYADGATWDLSNLTCVVPTSRAARRLQTQFASLARERALELKPPELITVGQLPDRLYRHELPIARDLEQSLAWLRVLRESDPDSLTILTSNVPDADSLGAWMELAAALRRLHVELASNNFTYTEIELACERPVEKARWKLLVELYRSYLAKLREANLCDPYEARRRAIAEDGCYCSRTIVLIGAFDLTPMLTRMLASLDGNVVTMVAAPECESERFDEFGVVRSQRWRDHIAPIEDHHLVAAGDVGDQATAIAETLADYASDWCLEDVTVGVTDESQVAPIEVELRGCGVSTCRHLGWLVAQTAVGRFLNLTTTFLQRRSWEALAALVRHADVHEAIDRALRRPDDSDNDDDKKVGGEANWLRDLDMLLANHFPSRIDKRLPGEARKRYPLAPELIGWIQQQLQPFLQEERRPIGEWSEALRKWLKLAFLHSSIERRPLRVEQAFAAVDNALMGFAEVNDRLDIAVSGPLAAEMITARLSDMRVVESAGEDDLEILGWLDLALDDAPVMVVNGLNHPFVPEAVTVNAFLPAPIRTQLRAEENDRRQARDLFAMQLMICSRPHVRFVVGRRGADGSPTPPSRLIAAASAPDVARRVRLLLDQRPRGAEVWHAWSTGPDQTRLPVPSIDEPRIPTALSVTAFRDYLLCPYRFYLRHVLKMKPIDDAASELAANQFGDLVHTAVERFGDSPDKHESSCERIKSALLDHLHDYARDHYGSDASAAVQLQVRQAARRLEFVALKQAERINAGWIIHAVEAAVDEKEFDKFGKAKPPAGLVVDGQRMGLRGRFDRIDRHAETNQWAILDYKTHGHKPEKKHLRRDAGGETWVDLQLPLYRLMIPFLGIEADSDDVHVGYFNVAEKERDCGINLAEFSQAQLEAAQRLIECCIRGIRGGRFEPSAEPQPYDDFSMILQTRILHAGGDSGKQASDQDVTAALAE